MDGKRTPGSGNGNLSGDVRARDVLIEAKETSQPALTLPLSWLVTLTTEAEKAHKMPAMAIEFHDGSEAFLIPIGYYEGDILQRFDLSEARSFRLKPDQATEGNVLVTRYEEWVIVGSDSFSSIVRNLSG